MAKSKWPQVEEKLALVEAWARDGLSEEQIAKNLGISRTTMETYKKKYPVLLDALKKGRFVQVQEVENSLYKAATGYYYKTQETHKVKVQGPNGPEEKVEVVTIMKFKPPETAAMCFFLKNKDKINWADNPQMLDVRREELELRKETAKFKEW